MTLKELEARLDADLASGKITAEEADMEYLDYLHRGDDAVYSDFIMTGNYNEESSKLECSGRSVDEQDTEVYEAFFSMTENGQLLYEAANGILLDYDFLGGSNG